MKPVLIDYCKVCGEELYFTIVTLKPFVANARCCTCCATRWAEDVEDRGNYNNVPFMARRAGIKGLVSNYS